MLVRKTGGNNYHTATITPQNKTKSNTTKTSMHS